MASQSGVQKAGKGRAFKTERVSWRSLMQGWQRVPLAGPVLHYVEDRWAFGPIQVRLDGPGAGNAPGGVGSGYSNTDNDPDAIVLLPGDSLYGLENVAEVYVRPDAQAFYWYWVTEKDARPTADMPATVTNPGHVTVAGATYAQSWIFGGQLQGGVDDGQSRITLASGTLFINGKGRGFTERRAILPAFLCSGTNVKTALLEYNNGTWTRDWGANSAGTPTVPHPVALVGHHARSYRRWRLQLVSKVLSANQLTDDQRTLLLNVNRHTALVSAAAFDSGTRAYPVHCCKVQNARTAMEIDAGPPGGGEGAFPQFATFGETVAANLQVKLQGVWILDHENPAPTLQCLTYEGTCPAVTWNGTNNVCFWAPGDNLVAEFTTHFDHITGAANLAQPVRGPLVGTNIATAYVSQFQNLANVAPGAATHQASNLAMNPPAMLTPGNTFVYRSCSSHIQGWNLRSGGGGHEWGGGSLPFSIRAAAGQSAPF